VHGVGLDLFGDGIHSELSVIGPAMDGPAGCDDVVGLLAAAIRLTSSPSMDPWELAPGPSLLQRQPITDGVPVCCLSLPREFDGAFELEYPALRTTIPGSPTTTAPWGAGVSGGTLTPTLGPQPSQRAPVPSRPKMRTVAVMELPAPGTDVTSTVRAARVPDRAILRFYPGSSSRRLDSDAPRCETATVIPDYRSQRSQSPEGAGKAKEAWEEFHLVQARDLTEEAASTTWSSMGAELPEDVRDDLVGTVIEESELLGFWLAWWRAGGFSGLEGAGWNRATIFRRLRRFRTTFGVHPDEYQPDWIQLDLPKVWAARLRSRLAASVGPDPTDGTVL
jgi:hypothetical protein